MFTFSFEISKMILFPRFHSSQNNFFTKQIIIYLLSSEVYYSVYFSNNPKFENHSKWKLLCCFHPMTFASLLLFLFILNPDCKWFTKTGTYGFVVQSDLNKNLKSRFLRTNSFARQTNKLNKRYLRLIIHSCDDKSVERYGLVNKRTHVIDLLYFILVFGLVVVYFPVSWVHIFLFCCF